MRNLVSVAAALALLAVQAPVLSAQAQTTAPVTSEPAAPVAGSDSTQPAAPSGTPAPKKSHKTAHHQSLQQRFDTANTSHDGKLTKDQAAAANWSYVVKNFGKIDKEKKGYVTEADIHNYAKAMHAAHVKKSAQPSSNG